MTILVVLKLTRSKFTYENLTLVLPHSSSLPMCQPMTLVGGSY